MSAIKKQILLFLLVIATLFTGCSSGDLFTDTSDKNTVTAVEQEVLSDDTKPDAIEEEPIQNPVNSTDILAEIPEFSGSAYIRLNNNIPNFDKEQLITTSYEKYSELDYLGRCGVVIANIGLDLMPTEERGSIGMVKPSGWHTVKYDIVDGKYLYNRCHLIGYQLSGENANVRNLITGTRYLNVEGMLPFENDVAEYVQNTGNHVLYRVTPIYKGDNLLANGLQLEAMSVEDNGKGIRYNVFCYNVQPGIEIDYANGDSKLISATTESAVVPAVPVENNTVTYIGNKNTDKFHYPTCSSVDDMKEKNKKYFYGDRSEVISLGYDPCGRCNP